MNTSRFLTFALVLSVAFLFVRCSESPKSDKAKTGDAKKVDTTAVTNATTMNVDQASSKVTWVGTKLVDKHNGAFGLKSGSVAIKEGKLTGGSFIIDIKSLKVLDIPADEEGNGKLVTHLLSKDFFAADKFPESTFEIVSVEDYKEENNKDRENLDKKYTLANPTHMITGNLELKGVKKSITFPAKVAIDGDKVTAEAKFNINRKDWGMNYHADESLKDKFIRPTVHIGFNVSAKK
ncbi:YceI family protein [Microscilla marina]|uniref:YceI family protein n=1 Tax=Microscilla marina TaxID=1027 RepID=UPI0003151F48|nr:YceI family protein [Microscilla marina]